MDFSWTDEQQHLYKEVALFSEQSLGEDLIERDHGSLFSTELWKKCTEKNVLRWSVPLANGGLGYSPLLCSYLMEALGLGCKDNGLLFALGTQMWGVQSCLLQFANKQQQDTYLTPMMEGNKIGAYAINEPASGSDAFALSTTAVPDGDDYVLNGSKSLISMSTVADFAVVFAVTDAKAGRWGISAFLVDSATPGFKAQPHEHMMGLRSVPFGGLLLDQCRVPKAALLGKPGSGAGVFNFSQCWERSLILAPQIGAMSSQLDHCVKFAKQQKRNGQSIGDHQAVSHRISNMKIRLETSRLLLYKTAWLLSEGKQNLMEAAITKTHISEAFIESSREAIAIHGGKGYLTETGMERQLRDAIGGSIYGGTVDMQRNIIAGLLGL